MLPTFSSPLPKTANAQVDIDEMIRITGQLSQLLTEECALLGEMKIRDIGPLQEEKQKLSQKLESFQRILAADNSAIKAAAPETREALLDLTDGLMDTIEENMRRTTIAQTVNQRVMKTIIEAMSEQQRVGIYGSQGQAHAETRPTLSINLNERA